VGGACDATEDGAGPREAGASAREAGARRSIAEHRASPGRDSGRLDGRETITARADAEVRSGSEAAEHACCKVGEGHDSGGEPACTTDNDPDDREADAARRAASADCAGCKTTDRCGRWRGELAGTDGRAVGETATIARPARPRQRRSRRRGRKPRSLETIDRCAAGDQLHPRTM
jgi:hypothetical protein